MSRRTSGTVHLETVALAGVPALRDIGETAGPAWPSGLTDAEAARRRSRGDANVILHRGSVSLPRILRRNVFTILNGVLFSVSLVLLALGLVGDALVTAGPVATNIVVAIVQEIDAKRKLDRLTLISRPHVTVRRSGRDRSARPERVVRGDIVVLQRGDQAVVDGTLVAGSVEVDESVLSGESEPVAKLVGAEIRSGSVCVSGTAAIEVERVGDETFANRLAAEARRGSEDRTPLRRDLDNLILVVGMLTVAASVPVGLALRASGEGLFSMTTVQSAAVLVALVPQGLAVMATVTYALAAVRISRAGAIVQRIDAVESMSRVDTLCLDKTGTLTAGAIVVEAVIPVDAEHGEVHRLLAATAAATTARNRTVDAISAALPGDRTRALYEVPFSSERRWSAVTLDDRGRRRTFLLAAPEVLGAAAGSHVGKAVHELTAAGRRVLLFAEADGQHLVEGAAIRPPASRPLAILGFREALRPDAAETLASLTGAGLDLKILSGDNPVTVAALAEHVGLSARGMLTGAQVEAMDGAELSRAVAKTSVFGRVKPEDKRKLVLALRQSGRYVGMTGDGVNDVPALRRAQLGIAMESGTPAARAVAGLVLLDDRFEILPRAIVEGQRVVSSMIAVATLLLSRTVYMLVIVVAAAVLGLPFPFTPRNNAVLALVTVGIPTLALTLCVPPIPAPSSVVRRIWRYAIPSGLAVAVLAIPVLVTAFDGSNPAIARSTITSLTVFSGIALIPILFPPVAHRSGPVGRGGDLRPTLLAVAMLALFAVVASVPLGREFFELTALPIDTVATLLVYTAAWMVAVIVMLRLRITDRLVAVIGAWPIGGSAVMSRLRRGR